MINKKHNDRFIPSRVNSRLHEHPLETINENIYNNRSDYINICNVEGMLNDKILAYYSGNHYTNDNFSFIHTNNTKETKVLLKCNRPYQVLDAPNLSTDYYNNLFSCSLNNMVTIPLANKVYLYDWNKMKKQTHTIDCYFEITNTSFSPDNTNILVSTDVNYKLELCDINYSRKRRTLSGGISNKGYVCVSDWKTHKVFACGHKRGSISIHDIRCSNNLKSESKTHSSTVCGLKYCPNGKYIASGGNDDKVMIWDTCYMDKPIHILRSHKAGVRAIAWNHMKSYELLTGGGTNDHNIKLWNLNKDINEQNIKNVDATEQVTNLYWSCDSKEIVSTHGFTRNCVKIWNSKDFTTIKNLPNCKKRIINSVMNIEKTKLITDSSVASDETISFWNIFSHTQNNTINNISNLNCGKYIGYVTIR